MRLLAANREKFSVLKSPANVMRPVAIVVKIDIGLRRHLREIKFAIRCRHHLQDRRTHKLQKGNEGRYGIAGQAKDGATASLPKKKWFARFDRHSPDVDLSAESE